MRKARQLQLRFPEHGGKRKGAGRKPAGDRAGVPHRRREKVCAQHPLHVTVRRAEGLPGLRRVETVKALRGAFAKGCERFGFRLVHFSIQETHLHLIVEAEDERALARGMQGLLVRVARALNKQWGRKGQVFPDRYHARVLGTPREVRRALCYVIHNAKKHGLRTLGGFDPFASGWWLDGWKERLEIVGLESEARPVARARSWLMRAGWKRHGLLSVGERPRAVG